MRRLLLLAAFTLVLRGASPIILDESHASKVFGEVRHYRIFLPPDYRTSGKRYPVIYWFHGWGERYNKPPAYEPARNYDQGEGGVYGGDTIARFVSYHDVIVVKWDGYNPRKPGEDYPRPYNVSPVETARQFPLYFPELVAHIDSQYRTIADREHRATAGLSMGGFMSFWVAGKYPHLVGSASNFMGSSEFTVGPVGFPAEYRHEEMHGNYDGVRTRIVIGTQDFIRFYHERMGAIWDFTRPFHETATFISEHGTPHMGETLDFHMRAFSDPLPQPEVWNHIDVYPDFSLWGWEVHSDRHEPGFTVLENVSRNGFASSVREWVPSGEVLQGVKLSVTTGKLYPPNEPQAITLIHRRGGPVERKTAIADAEGRLHIELGGTLYQVGIGTGAIFALGEAVVRDTELPIAGKPVRMQVRVYNCGTAESKATSIHWETPNPGVKFGDFTDRLPAIAAGKSVQILLAFTVEDKAREVAKMFAIFDGKRFPLEVSLLPEAPLATNFRIADGREFNVFQHGVKQAPLKLGKGNGDGQANPGETLAILVPDGDGWRAAELFSNDPCVYLAKRVSDDWGEYDYVGATAKISLPLINPSCTPPQTIRMLGRVQWPHKPDHRLTYFTVEFPIVKR